MFDEEFLVLETGSAALTLEDGLDGIVISFRGIQNCFEKMILLFRNFRIILCCDILGLSLNF